MSIKELFDSLTEEQREIVKNDYNNLLNEKENQEKVFRRKLNDYK